MAEIKKAETTVKPVAAVKTPVASTKAPEVKAEVKKEVVKETPEKKLAAKKPAAKKATTAKKAEPKKETVQKKPRGQDVPYTIKWGDTLWDISDSYYKTPWKYMKIADYNHIKNPDIIISGTNILIPAE